MTYAHVYKNARSDAFDEELAYLRQRLCAKEMELREARKIASVPSRIASCEGAVDAIETIIKGVERMKQC